jgi:hypothetical protein
MVSVSDGSSSATSFYLEESHVPIPEFPALAVPMLVTIALAIMLLKRNVKRIH